jgi:SAM-dependent methyltransferase
MTSLNSIQATSASAPPPPPVPDEAETPSRLAHFKRRFHAWWEGYEADAGRRPIEQAPSDEAKKSDKWSPERIKVAELIWGDGFTFPGGADHVLQMVKPMTLTNAKSMLDIGCGLGGATRAIAKTFGTWIVGMEASPVLAAAGMECSHRAGLAKKAPVQHFEPATVELPMKKYDAVCVRSVFGNVEDKPRLLGQIERALRPGGSVLICDFTVREQGLSSAALAAWQGAEDTPPQPCTLQDLQQNCGKLNIDLRVAEDMTAEFRNLVIQGWANLAGVLHGKKVEPGEAAALAKEIKLWQTRLAAIDSGDLRVARLFGLKKSGGWQGS